MNEGCDLNGMTGVEQGEKIMIFVKREMNDAGQCSAKDNLIKKSNTDDFVSSFCQDEKCLTERGENSKAGSTLARAENVEKNAKGRHEKGNGIIKLQSIKRKLNDTNNVNTLRRERENNEEDKVKPACSAVATPITGGFNDEGKKLIGKATKRKKKSNLELKVSEHHNFCHKKKQCLLKESFSKIPRKNDGTCTTPNLGEANKVTNNNVHVQRRILANARERSRVHKLGEAFSMLRNAIPSFSADQKLSKLSILRIAVSYIAALGSLLAVDVDAGAKQVFASNVNQCTFALQSEFGRAKGTRKNKGKCEKLGKSKRTKKEK